MRSISSVADRTLTWTQPAALKLVFALRAGDEQVGLLAFRSMFGTQATAESGDEAWTFKRTGFFHPRVTVRRPGSDDDLATFHNNTWSGGGSLVMHGGPTFRASTNFWQTKYEIATPEGDPLIRLHYGGLFKLHADVEILPAARALPELALIVLLSWYLAVMLYRDASAVAAAAG
jgi:hypothetical protein